MKNYFALNISASENVLSPVWHLSISLFIFYDESLSIFASPPGKNEPAVGTDNSMQSPDDPQQRIFDLAASFREKTKDKQEDIPIGGRNQGNTVLLFNTTPHPPTL